MLTRRSFPATFRVLFLMAVFVLPAHARGDKVIPQVADGPGIVTKFDLVNVSDFQSITRYKLRFFHQDGTPWTIQTTLGSGSEFVLNLGARQTLRIETLGQSSPATSGYAVFRDDETLNSPYSKDLVLGITAYYATSSGNLVTGIVSVPVSDPTATFSLPVEMNNNKNLYTGFAIVNLSGSSNQITLKLYPATDPASGSVGSPQTTTLTLQPGEQRAEFLHQRLYPGTVNIKGLLEGLASGPVSILGLVQIGTSSGAQYATITPTLRDYLRQNTNLLVIQPWLSDAAKYMPIDIDKIRVDYFQQGDGDESYPWDIKYETLGRGLRQLTPANGAGIIALGVLDTGNTFDDYSLASLRALQYSTNPIDLSDGSSNLVWGFSFAVRTDLGNYAKVRITRLIDTKDSSGNIYKDLGLEVCVYQ